MAEGKWTNTSISMTPEMLDDIRREAKQKGCSVSHVMRTGWMYYQHFGYPAVIEYEQDSSSLHAGLVIGGLIGLTLGSIFGLVGGFVWGSCG
ncbi:hypothetical protein C5Y96_17065 [Blastopirellula marina]|uniref:Uncharacterized protein n=2 Tax=Pirellulales TaxID=2691354 RepID=A0A2S8F7E9_9BACT|nr:hypothetical protein C5Y96_17065 [Blastopirellula marina]RCS48508.1 hypothetical protein DTL36_17090 [Bremerella cremea]